MCEEYAALLDMYVDGFCTEEETARVRAHLAECEDCRMYVEQILQMKEAFPDAEETEVPEGFAEGVMTAIRAQAAPRKKTMKSWQKTLVQMAACVALVIALGPISEMLTGGVKGGNAAPEAMSMSKAAYSGQDVKADAVDAVAEAPAAFDMESSTDNEKSAPAGGATAPAEAPEMPQYARKMKVRLTESQRQELFSGYVGTASEDGSFTYVLTAAEFDAVLAKIPAGDIIPGSEQKNEDGKNCCLTVYPAR